MRDAKSTRLRSGSERDVWDGEGEVERAGFGFEVGSFFLCFLLDEGPVGDQRARVVFAI